MQPRVTTVAVPDIGLTLGSAVISLAQEYSATILHFHQYSILLIDTVQIHDTRQSLCMGYPEDWGATYLKIHPLVDLYLSWVINQAAWPS